MKNNFGISLLGFLLKEVLIAKKFWESANSRKRNAAAFLFSLFFGKLGMQLKELPFVLPDAAQGTTCPHKAQRITFLLGEMPVDVGGGMEAVGQ